MHEGTFVFSQLMEFVPWQRFQTCVNRYGGDYKLASYKCVEQFRVMAFTGGTSFRAENQPADWKVTASLLR